MLPHLNPETFATVFEPFEKTVQMLDEYFDIENSNIKKRKINIQSDEVFDVPKHQHFFVLKSNSNLNISILLSNSDDGNIIFVNLFYEKCRLDGIRLRMSYPEEKNPWIDNVFAYYHTGQLLREVRATKGEHGWEFWAAGERMDFELDYESIKIKRNKLNNEIIINYLKEYDIDFQKDVYEQLHAPNPLIYIYSQAWQTYD